MQSAVFDIPIESCTDNQLHAPIADLETEFNGIKALYKEAIQELDADVKQHKMRSIFVKAEKFQTYPFAQYFLGLMYLNGFGVDQSPEHAFTLIKEAAEAHVENAVLQLGYLYENGEGTDPSDELAFKCFEEAADCFGLHEAQNHVGVIYFEGEKKPQSFEKAASYFLMAAKQDNRLAQFNLFRCHVGELLGSKSSPEEGGFWLSESAKRGFVKAELNKGIICYQQENYVEAFDWFQKAALQGDCDAQFNCGLMCENGQGVPTSIDQAIYWYVLSASQQHLDASNNLAAIYVQKGLYDTAHEMLISLTPSEYVEIFHNLGLLYANSKWEKYSYSSAFDWYLKAAQCGYAEAQFQVAYFYSRGLGVAVNHEKAEEWFLKAAKQGHVIAQVQLIEIYYKKGTEADLEEAFYWATEASKKQDPLAYYNLARFYENGQGGASKSFKRALEYYLNAFHGGRKEPLTSLGLAYLKGNGVLKDIEKAVHYWQCAAELGFYDAEYVLQFYREIEKKDVLKQEVERVTKIFSPHLKLEQYFISDVFAIIEREDLFEEGMVALEFYKEWCLLGQPQMQSYLGIMSYYGCAVLKDISRAIEYYQESAQRGNTLGQALYGALFVMNPEYCTEDLDKFIRYSLLSAADTQQDTLFSHYYLSFVLPVLDEKSGWTSKNYVSAYNQGLVFVKKLRGNIQRLAFPEGLRESIEKIKYAHSLLLKEDVSLCEKKEAITNYLDAAVLGNFFATSLLGQLFDEGYFLVYDSLLFNWCLETATNGDASFQYSLGKIYENGVNGTPVDLSEALNWYTKAADQGHTKAQYKQIDVLLKTVSNAEDIIKARSMLDTLVQQNYPPAIVMQSQFYINGTYQTADLGQIRIRLQNAAAQGNCEARDLLINMEREGDHTACIMLGRLYAQGDITRSTDVSDQDVFRWLEAAATQGDQLAYYRLGKMYEYGWGIEKDEHKAFNCFNQSTSDIVLALKAIADCYLYGKGVERSECKAVRWYRKAAKQGDIGATESIKELADDYCTEALYVLGKAHEKGWGIASDSVEAITYYKKTIAFYHPKSEYEVAMHLLRHSPTQKERVDALELLTQAAGLEARKRYAKHIAKRLKSSELDKVSKCGYYKAQQALARQYEDGTIIEMRTLDAIYEIYRHAKYLHEMAYASGGKHFQHVDFLRINQKFEQLSRLKQEGKVNFEEGLEGIFGKFMKHYGSLESFDADYIYQMAYICNKIHDMHPQTADNIYDLLQLLSSSMKYHGQTQNTKALLKLLIETIDALPIDSMVSRLPTIASEGQKECFLLDEITALVYKDTCTKRWSYISTSIPASCTLRVTHKAFYDASIILFNTIFQIPDASVEPDIFDAAVLKILNLFSNCKKMRLINDNDLLDVDSSSVRYGNRETLNQLLTFNKEKERFKFRVIYISDRLDKAFEEDPAHVAAILMSWSIAGYNCSFRSEEETYRYYIRCLSDFDNQSHSTENRGLELRVACSLSTLRESIIENLVPQDEEERYHQIAHLKRKVNRELTLLGDIDKFQDRSESISVLPRYMKMTKEQIIEKVKEHYTPEQMISHIVNEFNQLKLPYIKLEERLRFQFLRDALSPEGFLDHTLFKEESYILSDQCTSHDVKKILISKEVVTEFSLKQASNIQALKGQSYAHAQQILQEYFYDPGMLSFSRQGAQAILQSMGYVDS